MPYRKTLCTRLNDPLREMILALPRERAGRLEEIRVRRLCRTELVFDDESRFCPHIPDDAGVQDVVAALSGHSLYAYERQIAQGYITMPGGHRAGLCGRMTADEKSRLHLTSVTSVCIRIARHIEGASGAIRPFLTDERGAARRVLLLGPPGCGKTTALRDAAIWLSQNKRLHVCVADEREELFPPGCTYGGATDVLGGMDKAQALTRLLRAMAPQVLVTDEIATAEDAMAIEAAARCGVGVIASAHASSIADAADRPGVGRLMQSGAIDCCVLLGRHGACLDVWETQMDGKGRVHGGGGDGAPWREHTRVSSG